MGVLDEHAHPFFRRQHLRAVARVGMAPFMAGFWRDGSAPVSPTFAPHGGIGAKQGRCASGLT